MGRASHVVALGACGLMLAGCGSSSLSDFMPSWGSGNAKATLQLNSEPAGALAKTSLGATCQTPCALELVANSDFTVTFSLDGYQPQTVAVKPKPSEGPPDLLSSPTVQLVPNPVMAQLEPVPPPASVKKKKPKIAKPHTASIRQKPAVAAPPDTQSQTAPQSDSQASPWPAPPPAPAPQR